MARRQITPVKVWVTAEEKAFIRGQAGAARQTLSGYARNLLTSHIPKGTADPGAAFALAKANADQGRVGGLLKLLITRLDSPTAQALRPEINRLLEELRETQGVLRQAAERFQWRRTG